MRVTVFTAYCLTVSALLVALGDHHHLAFATGLLVLSVALGRLLPGWGFAAPAFLGVLWLVPALVGTEPGEGRGLAMVYLFIGVALAEAGVLLGSVSAAWSWTTRGLRESTGSAER